MYARDLPKCVLVKWFSVGLIAVFNVTLVTSPDAHIQSVYIELTAHVCILATVGFR